MVEGQWVGRILPKLQGIDVKRLSGGKTSEAAIAAAEAAAQQAEQGAQGQQAQGPAGAERRNTDAAVDAARARYLARKKARGK